MDLGLTERVFLVTGGTRGLGAATAEVLTREGAKVVVSSRTATYVDATVAGLGARNATGVTADNSDPTTPARLIDAALQSYGRLDGALISVGGPPVGAATQVTDEDWLRSFHTLFLGAVRIARSVVDVLEPGGSIAFVLSSSVRSPIPNLAVSNGLRPGLAMFAKTLAEEVGPRGIRVNGLLPGRHTTGRTTELEAGAPDAPALRQRLEAGIPLRRYGQPIEFGRVGAFVLSPAASYLTGTMIPVDGGALRVL